MTQLASRLHSAAVCKWSPPAQRPSRPPFLYELAILSSRYQVQSTWNSICACIGVHSSIVTLHPTIPSRIAGDAIVAQLPNAGRGCNSRIPVCSFHSSNCSTVRQLPALGRSNQREQATGLGELHGAASLERRERSASRGSSAGQLGQLAVGSSVICQRPHQACPSPSTGTGTRPVVWRVVTVGE